MTGRDGGPAVLSAADLRAMTPARVALGRTGASLTTRALLDFTLDHARARDAVHAPFDATALAAALAAEGIAAIPVHSDVRDRSDYLRRPDLGRRLAADSRALLASEPREPCDIAIVLGDGLSPAAVNERGLRLLRAVLDKLDDLTIAPVVVATGARVALGDEVGALLRARMVVVLIGERPGLSAPQSIGGYLSLAPRPGLTDADRNCVSNIQPAGLSDVEAAGKIAWLARAGLSRGVTGVALKDESGLQTAPRLGGA